MDLKTQCQSTKKLKMIWNYLKKNLTKKRIPKGVGEAFFDEILEMLNRVFMRCPYDARNARKYQRK